MRVEDLFKALSCRWRIAIIKMVAQRPLCQCEMDGVLPLDKTNLSRHVKALRIAGIVGEETRGPAKKIYLRNPRVLELLALAEEIVQDEVEEPPHEEHFLLEEGSP